MTNLDPDEIKRVKLHPVKCSKCKLTEMVKPDDKVCPVCGSSLPRPAKLRSTTISCARVNLSGV